MFAYLFNCIVMYLLTYLLTHILIYLFVYLLLITGKDSLKSQPKFSEEKPVSPCKLSGYLQNKYLPIKLQISFLT